MLPSLTSLQSGDCKIKGIKAYSESDFELNCDDILSPSFSSILNFS